MVTEEKTKGKAALRGLLEGGAGLMLACAQPLGLCAPFGIALCSGAGSDAGGLCCLFGTMLGYLLSRGIDGGLRYCAASLLAFSAAFIFRDTPAVERKWFLPSATAVITLLCGVLSFFEGKSPLRTALCLLTELALSAVGSHLFALLRKSEAALTESESRARSFGWLLLYAGGIMALCRLTFFGGFTPGHIPAVLTVLLFAQAGGSVKGCVAGVIMGLCTLRPAELSLSCALGGLMAGLAPEEKRAPTALLFSLGFLAPLLPAWTGELWTLSELALALLGFFCLPKKLLRKLTERLSPRMAEGSEELRRSYAALHIAELAGTLGELYESVSRQTQRPEEDDIATVYDRAAECVCATCLRKELCWHTEYLHMLSLLNDATELVRRRGKLSLQELPERFRESCVHPEAFLQAVNGELRAVSYRRQLRARLEENRTAAYGLFRILSRVLEEQSRSQEEGQKDTALEQRLSRFLHANGMDCRVSAFRDSNGRLRILLEGENISLLREREAYTEELSRAAGLPLSRTGGERDSLRRMELSESEALQATVAIAAAKKQGESVSGDRGTWFRTERGQLCLLLSDGMGSGEEAAREAVATVRALEELLRSGVAAEEALELVNGLMLLKNGDSWAYATVDLVTVDLFSGECLFYKYGAAPSYVRCGGEVKRVRGVALAAGILSGENEKRELPSAKLRSGDILLVCSDGVASEQSDGWLRQRLAAFAGAEPKQLARELLDEATQQYGRCDDMTVLALRLDAREA